MTDFALGNCEWPDPHPPHLWGEQISLYGGGTVNKVFACDGTGPQE